MYLNVPLLNVRVTVASQPTASFQMINTTSVSLEIFLRFLNLKKDISVQQNIFIRRILAPAFPIVIPNVHKNGSSYFRINFE